MKSFNYFGQEIAIQTFGPDDAPVIIAIHGWLDNSNSFLPLSEDLADYKIYALDLPGHGHSSHVPDYATYHFIDGVTILIEFIRQTFTKPILLMGHSLGACIASMALPHLNHLIEKAIFIDALGPLVTNSDDAFLYYQQYLKKLSQHVNDPPCYKTKELAYAMRARGGHLSLENAKILCDRALIQKEDGYYFRHDRKLQLPSPSRLTEEMVLSFLKEITTPSLLIEASDGFPFDKNIMIERVNAIAKLTHKKVEGGHHLHMEKPGRIAKMITDFIC